ncbi:hypothetical protein BMETH_2605_0 [methanotrophic bacterial endosymbiont of Bathymodiolus sp.]|nr:hypothetical protein BMETH_2605_0 [methanotrophic bacterial endosymbiont of Bathymodiolus sp.]
MRLFTWHCLYSVAQVKKLPGIQILMSLADTTCKR